MPADFDTSLGSVDKESIGGDSDLEAELAALTGGDEPTRPMRRKNAKIVPQEQLDSMVAGSVEDIESDDDVSVDENDPELLGELSELTSKDNLGQNLIFLFLCCIFRWLWRRRNPIVPFRSTFWRRKL